MSRVFFPAASFSRSKASLEKKKRKKLLRWKKAMSEASHFFLTPPFF
jgi:hypothetical protein